MMCSTSFGSGRPSSSGSSDKLVENLIPSTPKRPFQYVDPRSGFPCTMWSKVMRSEATSFSNQKALAALGDMSLVGSQARSDFKNLGFDSKTWGSNQLFHTFPQLLNVLIQQKILRERRYCWSIWWWRWHTTFMGTAIRRRSIRYLE